MSRVDLAIVVAASLVLVAILSARFSQRFGMPALVLFVAVGMFAGSSGPLGIEFEDYGLSLNIGLLALAVIIFSGGLDTRYRLFRAAVLPAGLLATVGVLLTAGILALIAWWFTPLDLVTSLLLGAVLGSTDAAATFAALKGRGLPGRLKAVLETESGTNDPVAIYLTMALVSMAGAGALGAFGLVAGVVLQLGLGALYGWVAGRALVFVINRVALDGAGLYPVLALAGALLAYGLANVGYGNGFVTIYVVGLVLGNAHLAHRRSIAAFMDGAAWGAQVLMFVLLGLLSFPERLGASLPAAIVITLALAFLARPLGGGRDARRAAPRDPRALRLHPPRGRARVLGGPEGGGADHPGDRAAARGRAGRRGGLRHRVRGRDPGDRAAGGDDRAARAVAGPGASGAAAAAGHLGAGGRGAGGGGGVRRLPGARPARGGVPAERPRHPRRRRGRGHPARRQAGDAARQHRVPPWRPRLLDQRRRRHGGHPAGLQRTAAAGARRRADVGPAPTKARSPTGPAAAPVGDPPVAQPAVRPAADTKCT